MRNDDGMVTFFGTAKPGKITKTQLSNRLNNKALSSAIDLRMTLWFCDKIRRGDIALNRKGTTFQIYHAAEIFLN